MIKILSFLSICRFGLRVGPGILGSLSVVSGLLINNHFRTKLKLGSYGRFSTYLPIVVIPAIMTTVFHKVLVQSDIILRKYDCPVCLQTRAAVIQCGFGVVYPLILGPLASFMFATRHFTYRLPSIIEQPKEIIKLWYKFTKSASSTGSILLFANLMAAMFITYREINEHHKISLELYEVEKKYENDMEESEMLRN